MKKKNQTTVIVIIVISVLAVAGVLIWGFTSNWGQGKSSSQKADDTAAAAKKKEEEITMTDEEEITMTDEQYCEANKNMPSINSGVKNGCAGATWSSGAVSEDYCKGEGDIINEERLQKYKKFYTTCCQYNENDNKCESKY